MKCILNLMCYGLMFLCLNSSAQEKREITLTSFSELSVEGNFNVELVYSNQHKVILTGKYDVLKHVNVKQKDNKVVVNYTKRGMHGRISVKVYSKSFRELHLSGHTKTNSQSIIKENVLDLTLNGSGDAELSLDVKDMNGKINGSGTLAFDGKVSDNAIFGINGSGDIKAEKLNMSNAITKINGSGSIQIGDISIKLKAKINGSGSILYKSASSIDIAVKGSGRVKAY